MTRDLSRFQQLMGSGHGVFFRVNPSNSTHKALQNSQIYVDNLIFPIFPNLWVSTVSTVSTSTSGEKSVSHWQPGKPRLLRTEADLLRTVGYMVYLPLTGNEPCRKCCISRGVDGNTDIYKWAMFIDMISRGHIGAISAVNAGIYTA